MRLLRREQQTEREDSAYLDAVRRTVRDMLAQANIGQG
jgi:hypothetical protein